MRRSYSKASQILGLIHRIIQYKDPTVLVSLYKSMVRPHLEKCSVVWSPHYAGGMMLVCQQTSICRLNSWHCSSATAADLSNSMVAGDATIFKASNCSASASAAISSSPPSVVWSGKHAREETKRSPHSLTLNKRLEEDGRIALSVIV